MQATDRIYFVDPTQAPTLDHGAEATILVTDTYAEDSHIAFGSVVKVVGIHFDHANRAWYTTESSEWVDGALINAPITARQTSIGWFEADGLTVYGRRSTSTHGDLNTFIGNRRSDQRRFGRNGDIDLMKIPYAVKAAPWATHLFPQVFDRPEVVEAKLAQAKLRWDQARKHAFILREGMHRGWLGYLKEDGIHTDHGMPYPRWDVYAEGSITVQTGTARHLEREAALAAMPSQMAERLRTMQPARPAPNVPVRESVTVGYRTTLETNREFENRSEVTSADELITSHMQDRLSNYDSVITVSTARPILAALIPVS